MAMDAALPTSEGKRLSLSHYLALVRKFDEFVAANAGKTRVQRRRGTAAWRIGADAA